MRGFLQKYILNPYAIAIILVLTVGMVSFVIQIKNKSLQTENTSDEVHSVEGKVCMRGIDGAVRCDIVPK